MVSFYSRIADEQIFTSERDRGNKVIPELRECVYIWTYDPQLLSSWHWNLLHLHCAVTEKGVSGAGLFKRLELSLWVSYLKKKQHFSSCKNVCLLYAAVPSELLEASKNWVVSPSQIMSLFVMVSRLWLAVSDLHGKYFWPTCAVVVRQPGIVLLESQEWVISKFNFGFLAWYYLGWRMGKILMKNNTLNSKVLLSVKNLKTLKAYREHT